MVDELMVTGKQGNQPPFLGCLMEGSLQQLCGEQTMCSHCLLCADGCLRGRMESALLVYKHDNARQSGVRKRICVRERIGRRYKI